VEWEYREWRGESQTHKALIAADEYLGGQILMQFDFPDGTTIADQCGLIEHQQ
jgi:hypothetical protein